MLSKRKGLRQAEDIFTQLAIRVEHYEVRVAAAISHDVYAPQFAWNLDDNDPVYPITTRLTITGVSTYPEERAGDSYELTIYGDDAPSRRLNATLKDVQVRDQYGSLEFRKYRDRQIPVYHPPEGMGLIEKVKGEPRWTAWFHTPVRFASNLVSLLGHNRVLFISLNERRKAKARWILGMSLQTVDPAEE